MTECITKEEEKTYSEETIEYLKRKRKELKGWSKNNLIDYIIKCELVIIGQLEEEKKIIGV